jgi:predicted molibdopterin-dependent oxidoreductase YjgC|tara:strand:+ start:390 stop:695 length:306 start_codon:yes stop_codon:yes gene_type:complete
MTEKKRVSHLNYTLAGSSSNEQALNSGGKEILQEVVESANKNNPRISASEVNQVNQLRTYPGKSHPHFIEDDDRCICGRLLSENYWKNVDDNCYVHMTQGY